ncbi:hypothetical protein GGS26DRAFT_538536 [Hypomontagnella submonticulosa]|nr:hypothetical protein GGS26DRAFT_538536 [Hypomontagnella submonticulosa]
MDKATSSASLATSTRTKAPKKRNSDVRKEQNRIASRAYREKRKQKLALLDEILKSDSQTDSMSSVSDETEGYTGSWSLQSRQASNSPAPSAMHAVPVATPWPAASPSMSSSVPAYGHDTYDGWMNSFEQPNNVFPAANNYVHPFIHSEIGGNSLENAASYNVQSIAAITSAPSTPPVAPIPLDPMLVPNHFVPQRRHHQPEQGQNLATSSNPGYDDDEMQRQLWVASLEDGALLALERFAGFSHAQQQQTMAMIQKRRHISQNASNHHGIDFRYQTCQATPPPSTRFVNTDFRKYQSMRQASGSPSHH